MSQKYLVLYEYESRYDSELDLVKDEIITLLSTEEGGWSEGKNEKGKLGWYPTAFVAPYNGGAVSQVSNASPQVPIPPRSSAEKTAPETRSPSSTPLSSMRVTRDDSVTLKKKKNRSLFTKSVKLSSEDIKRKGDFVAPRKESSLANISAPPSNVTPPSIQPQTPTPAPTPSPSPSFPPPFANKSISNPSPSSSPQIPRAAPLSQSMDLNSLLHPPAADGEFSILENKKKTSNYLAKWLNNRTSKQQLKEKGVLAEEAVEMVDTIYGVALETILNEHGSPIPRFISECVDFLTKTAIKEQGIFRVSGVSSVVSNLGQLFAKPNNQISLDSFDCHAVSGCLKKFFRDLPDPLFTYEAHDAFLSATTIENKQERAKQYKNLFNGLPKANKELIFFLLKFLYEVITHSEVNLMHANNLGVVFGPTLMRSKEDSLSGFMNPTNNSVGTIAALISDFNLVFTDINLNDSTSNSNNNNNNNNNNQSSSIPCPQTEPRLRSSGDQTKVLQSPAKPSFKPSPPQRLSSSLTKPLDKIPVPAPKPPPKKEEPKVKVEIANALYDYNGDAALSQLSFKAGDKIQIVLKHPSGWWTGIVNGKQGLFPMNFIKTQ